MNTNIKPAFDRVMILAVALAAGMSGCSRSADPNRELEKAAKTLEEPAAVATAPATAQPAQPVQATAPQNPQTKPVPAQQMSAAMAAYKGGQLVDAVTQFQKLRSQVALTPQQRMALQDAIAAVMGDIYARAAKGDARAKQAVAEYERMQTAQH